MSRSESRRAFFAKTALGAAGVLAAPFALIGASASRRVSPARPVTRRNLAGLRPDAPEVRRLRDAIRLVQRAGGPRGWPALAKVHADACAAGAHGSALFLPWHRAYLQGVEKEFQRVTGSAALAIPYWDWTRDRSIPVHFAAPGALRDATRRAGPEEELPPDFVDVGSALRASGFEALGGAPDPDSSDFPAIGLLEATGAGNVRHWVGGRFADCASAALDPLYLAYWANLDRLWEAWRAAAPERSAVPSEWEKGALELPEPSGKTARFAWRSLFDSAGLGYRYDDLEFSVSPRNEPSPAGARRAVLRSDRSQLPALPATFRLFLNNRNAVPATKPEGSTYAGTFTLFPGEGKQGPEVAIPLEVSAEMGHRIAVQATVSVTLIPLSVPGRPKPPQSIRLQSPRIIAVA
ncbi:MAG: tyrosinase family protein [Thermoanaerobaculia bacterium]